MGGFMSNFLAIYLIAGVTVAYLITSAILAIQGNPKLALVFFGYAISNIGLMLATW
jgi:hypothetical protein